MTSDAERRDCAGSVSRDGGIAASEHARGERAAPSRDATRRARTARSAIAMRGPQWKHGRPHARRLRSVADVAPAGAIARRVTVPRRGDAADDEQGQQARGMRVPGVIDLAPARSSHTAPIMAPAAAAMATMPHITVNSACNAPADQTRRTRRTPRDEAGQGADHEQNARLPVTQDQHVTARQVREPDVAARARGTSVASSAVDGGHRGLAHLKERRRRAPAPACHERCDTRSCRRWARSSSPACRPRETR